MKIIDTRELYKRKCELESYRDDLTTANTSLAEAEKALAAFDPDRPDVAPDDEAWYEEKDKLEEAVADAQGEVEAAEAYFGLPEEEELAELETLENEVSEFMHGETLISEDYFEDYAREMAEDIHGRSIRDAKWPFTCIDWSEAADELRQDYSETEYQGTTYLFRS